MITKEDIIIYEALKQEKKVTEVILGHATFPWEYALINYTAECTYGIDFDLFDKVIVGILQVDEVLSIEEIGEILGMNIVHDPENFRIRDEAEFDILRIALDNLVDYDMIETGDIYYSACRLTSLGREYAEKGRKFRTVPNKAFTLFYDHTSGDHPTAFENFRDLRGEPSRIIDEDEYLDEKLIKQIASVQAPEIYDMEKGNSFRNPEINFGKSMLCKLEVWVVLLADLNNGAARIIALDPVSKKVLDFATLWFNENHLSEVISEFSTDDGLGTDIPLISKQFEAHIERLGGIQDDFDDAIENDPESAMDLLGRGLISLDFVEKEFLWLNMEKIIPEETEDVLIFLPDPADEELKRLRQLVKRQPQGNFFFVLGQDPDPDNSVDRANAFADDINTSPQRFYCLKTTAEIREEIWVIQNSEAKRYRPHELALDVSHKRIGYQCLHRSTLDSSKASDTISWVKADIGGIVLEGLHDQILSQTVDALADEQVTKEKIIAYSNMDRKIVPLVDYLSPQQRKGPIKKIREAMSGLVATKKEKLRSQLQSRAEGLLDALNDKEIPEVAVIIALREKAKKIEQELFEEFTETKTLIKEILRQLNVKEQFAKDNRWAKTYIIDTNVFIDDPNILSKIGETDYVALNLMVIEELDRLKTRPETREKARKAIKNIHAALRSSNGKQSRIRKARSSLDLLPEELREPSADNYILSIAMIYKEKNPVLVTFDKNLESKAIMLEIPTFGKKEIYRLANDQKKPDQSGDKGSNERAKKGSHNAFLGILNKITPDNRGVITVGAFIREIKRRDPKFDYKALGFVRASDFVRSLPGISVDKNEIKK